MKTVYHLHLSFLVYVKGLLRYSLLVYFSIIWK